MATGIIPVPASLLRNTPFDSFLVPGLFLGMVVGGSAAIGAMTSFAQTRRSAYFGGVAGVVLIGWIAGETILIEAFSWLQGLYLLTGVLVVVLAALVVWSSPAMASARRPTASPPQGRPRR